jgi:hypothetical protein
VAISDWLNSMSEASKSIENVAKDARYFPTLVGIFVLGLLLLFLKELSDPMRQYLLPSLVIYVLGTSFLGYWQSMLAWREELKNKDAEEGAFIGTRPRTFAAIVILHVLWLFMLIAYNVYRQCL